MLVNTKLSSILRIAICATNLAILINVVLQFIGMNIYWNPSPISKPNAYLCTLRNYNHTLFALCSGQNSASHLVDGAL